MNGSSGKPLPAWLPLAVGFAVVALFAVLGTWQIGRGLEKRTEIDAFAHDGSFASWRHGAAVRPFQRLRVTGAFDGTHQFLLENITHGGRPGFYVLTPLASQNDEPLLLVNRGWIADAGATDLTVPAGNVTVRGRVGRLPRAAFHMGDPIAADDGWPRHAVFPATADVVAALGQEVQPFVLLMDPDDDGGFIREWAPPGFGPGRHFGYALQWFAMAAVLSGLLVWNYRKKRFDS